MSAEHSSEGRTRWILVLLLVAGLGLLAIPFLLPPPAKLELEVADPVFSTDLAGRTLEVSGDDAVPRRVPVREKGGRYLAWVGRAPSGGQAMTVRLPNFETAGLSLSLPPLDVTRARVELRPTFGRLKVQARNAREKLERVMAEVRVNGQLAGSGGDVTVSELPPGEHQVAATAPGYCPADTTATVEARQTSNLLLPMSPLLGPGEAARIILDWGENPRDLDAHLVLHDPPTNVINPTVFWSRMLGTVRGEPPFATLDVDHRQSEGFETITLNDRLNGLYQFYVHRYAGTGTIASSEASVHVITGNCNKQPFQPPADCNQDLWHVADLRMSGGQVEILPRGNCLSRDMPGWIVPRPRSLQDGLKELLETMVGRR